MLKANDFGNEKMKDIIELNIKGMTCDSCASHVSKALASVNGVETVKINGWKSAHATVNLKEKTDSKCGDIKKLADEKIKDIEDKIKDLRNIKKHLAKLATQCVHEELSLDDCPIVKALTFN